MSDTNAEFQPPAVIFPAKELLSPSVDSLSEYLKDPEVKALPRKPGLLLLFGQGPVLNNETRDKANTVTTGDTTADINYWSKEIAAATKALYAAGEGTKIVVMGGKTGGNEYPSEAEFIREYITSDPRSEIPQTDVLAEDQSTNTLENLINVCNQYLDSPDHPELKDLPVHVVGSDYHIGRIQLLMELFDIPFKHAFSAESVSRFVAQRYGDTEKLNELDNRLNINTRIDDHIAEAHGGKDQSISVKEPPDYFDKQKGDDTTEKKPALTRLLEEDLWTRFLLSEPAYWVGTLAGISADGRLQRVLDNISEIMPGWGEKVGVDLTGDLQTIKSQLKQVDRTKVRGLKNLDERPDFYHEHIRSGYPTEIADRLETFLQKRSQKRQLESDSQS